MRSALDSLAHEVEEESNELLSSGSSSKAYTNDLGWNLALEYLGCLEEAAGEGLRMADALQEMRGEIETYKEKVKKIEEREKDVRENLEKEREARRVSEAKCGDAARTSKTLASALDGAVLNMYDLKQDLSYAVEDNRPEGMEKGGGDRARTRSRAPTSSVVPTVEDPEEGARRLENGIKGLSNEIIELGNTLRMWKTQGDENLRELAGFKERGEKSERDLAEAKSRLSSIQELVERERAARANEIEKLRADCIVQVTAAEEAQGRIAGERIRGVEREVRMN